MESDLTRGEEEPSRAIDDETLSRGIGEETLLRGIVEETLLGEGVIVGDVGAGRMERGR